MLCVIHKPLKFAVWTSELCHHHLISFSLSCDCLWQKAIVKGQVVKVHHFRFFTRLNKMLFNRWKSKWKNIQHVMIQKQKLLPDIIGLNSVYLLQRTGTFCVVFQRWWTQENHRRLTVCTSWTKYIKGFKQFMTSPFSRHLLLVFSVLRFFFSFIRNLTKFKANIIHAVIFLPVFCCETSWTTLFNPNAIMSCERSDLTIHIHHNKCLETSM